MEDRAEKLKEIERERVRLEKLIAMPAEQLGGENGKYTRVYGLRRRLELLKIQADINDPIVKRKFEDGEGMAVIYAFNWGFSNVICVRNI